MEREFDLEGFFCVLEEIERAYVVERAEELKNYGFCQVCLGANYPGYVKDRPEGSWCCGSWVDCLLPALRICERFQVDYAKLRKVAESIRPAESEKGLVGFRS